MQKHNAFEYRKKREILDFIAEHGCPPPFFLESADIEVDPEVLNFTTAGLISLQAYPREAIFQVLSNLEKYHPGNFNRLMKGLQDWCVRNSVVPDTNWSEQLRTALNITPQAPLFELPKKITAQEKQTDYKRKWSRQTVNPEPTAQAKLKHYLSSPYPFKDDKGLGNYYKVNATVGVENRISELQTIIAHSQDQNEIKACTEEINQLRKWHLQDKSEAYVPNLSSIKRNASQATPITPESDSAHIKQIKGILDGLIWAIGHDHTTQEERDLLYKEHNRLAPPSPDAE